MTAAEDRLAEIEARARENWPTSEDVATVAAALRAVLALTGAVRQTWLDRSQTGDDRDARWDAMDALAEDIDAEAAVALDVTP